MAVPSRRAFLDLCMALALAGRARGADGERANGGELTWLELPLDADDGSSRRALVMYPTQRAPGQTYPGLLLFHGRGETTSEQVGIHAWRAPYGLERSDARLRHPPLVLAPEERPFIEAERLARLNAALLEKPFGGLVVICPFTPNPRRNAQPGRVLDRYSEWIEHTLLPAAGARAPLDPTRGIGVDGCSMGGYVAAEVFVRKPHIFRSFGVVQPAIGEHRVARYARHLARALQRQSLRAIHLQTSTRDPYRGAVNALARHLKRQGVRFTLEVLPGPHDQRWLRAAGTLAMLAWHDYILS
jgi:enterochelin esterase-like enzyme